MSYSFTVRAASHEAAIDAVTAKLDEIVIQQPIHARDRDQAQVCAAVFITMAPQPGEGEELSVSVNGYLAWRGEADAPLITGTSFGVQANIVTKAA